MLEIFKSWDVFEIFVDHIIKTLYFKFQLDFESDKSNFQAVIGNKYKDETREQTLISNNSKNWVMKNKAKINEERFKDKIAIR